MGKGHFLQEQIVKGPAASLPRRKSLDERNEAKDQALYYSLRDRIPSDLAMTPGAGGQALRRVMLHGATVVFVTPGYEGKRFVFERAKDLGVRSVVIDAPGSWAERMVGERVIAKFIPLDLNRDSTSVLNDCAAAIRAQGFSKGVSFDLVVPWNRAMASLASMARMHGWAAGVTAPHRACTLRAQRAFGRAFS